MRAGSVENHLVRWELLKKRSDYWSLGRLVKEDLWQRSQQRDRSILTQRLQILAETAKMEAVVPLLTSFVGVQK